MGVTRSNSGLLALQVLLSQLWEKEKGGGEKNKEGKEGKRE